MNKWLHKFMEKPDISDKPDRRGEKLENMPWVGPDKPDRFDPPFNLSGLSGSPGAFFCENLDNLIKIGPDISDNTDKPGISDKPDILDPNLNMSGLSGSPWGLLDEKMEKVKNHPRDGGDKSDRFNFEANMSDLSGRPQDVLEGTSTPYDEQDFEERLAIAEHDGGQMPLHDHRIAYLDAFISALTAFPAQDSQKDWLEKRIQISLAWIEAQAYL